MGSIPGLKKLKEIFNLESDGTILTLLQGKDDTDTKHTVSVDSEGRINLGADIDIGNIHLLDTTDTEIDPATEGTLDTVLKTNDQPLDVSSAEVDIDINSQTLAQISALLELDDGAGAYGEIYRRNNSIRQSIENDQVGLVKTTDFTYDADGNLKTNIRNLTSVEDEVTAKDDVFASVSYGQDTVATAGTAEALNGGTSLTVPKGSEVLIKALGSNTGDVYVGDSTVSSSDGFPLSAGEELALKVNDVSTIYIDVDTGGEGVRWIIEST